MNRFLLLLFLTLLSVQTHATVITWKIDISPRNNAHSSDIRSGSSLIVSFDDEIILHGTNSTFSITRRKIVDFTLLANGQIYNAGNHIEHGAGNLDYNQYTPDHFSNEDGYFDRLIISLYLKDSGAFSWDIGTFSDKNVRLLPIFDYSDVVEPSLDVLTDNRLNYAYLSTDSYNGAGKVVNWTLVPEPPILAIFSIGLIGFGLTARRTKT